MGLGAGKRTVGTPRETRIWAFNHLFIGVIVAALALSSIHLASAATASKTTLTIGMIEPIDSLNPFVGVNDNAYIFYGLVYDYLIAADQDLKPKPDLAASWNIVTDQLPVGSVWQYNLTRNATWHDGEPFDADDVVFTINFQIGPNYASMWAYQPYTKLIDKIDKIDNYTVRIHFKNFQDEPAPCSFGDALMFPIIPEHIWGKMSANEAAFVFQNYYPIGTGPFMCTNQTEGQFLKGERLILDANMNYHGPKPKFDRIVLEWYLEPAAMVADMQRGAIDLAMFNAPQYKNLMDWLAANPDTPIGHYAGLQCTGFSVELGISQKDAGGTTNSLRLDPEVRRAMALATDKQFIIDYIYKGYAIPGTGMLTPMYKDWYWTPSSQTMTSLDQWGPADGLTIPYSLEMANETLEAAGYQWDGNHRVRVSNSSNPYSPDKSLSFEIIVESELFEDREVAQFLSEEYAKVGIQLTIVPMNSRQWNTQVYSGAYDLTITYWSGDPDPNYLLYIQSTYALDGWSDNWYSNPEYDTNYSDSVFAVDPVAREGFVHNTQMHTYYDVPYVVYAYPFGCYAWRTDHFSGWGNWSEHPGRTLSSFWTANDLWFDLTPTGGQHTSNLATYVGVGTITIIAVVAVTALLLRRRGGSGRLKEEKEDDVKLP